MKLKKIASLALAAAMLIAPFAFSSCADNTNEGPGGIDDDLAMLPSTFDEQKDLGGRKFVVLTYQDRSKTQAFNVVDLIGGETNIGDEGISTAVQNRNDRLKAVFNFTIDRDPVTDVTGDARMAIQKRDDTYGAFMLKVQPALNLATEGTLVDYSSIGYLDLQGSYWDTAIMENLLLLDGAYLAMGDINTVDDDCCWCVLFNKELYKEFTGNEASMLYNQVKDGIGTTGGWTIDTLKSLASDNFIADQQNPNKYEKDYSGMGTYGLISQSEVSTVLLQSSGHTPTISTGVGFGYTSNMNGQFIDAVQAVFGLFGGTDKTQWHLNMNDVPDRTGEDKWETIARGSFKRDRSIFFVCHVGTVNLVRDMESEFGILPIPKLFSSQTEYGNTIQYNNATCYVVPSFSDASDTEATYVLEAMGYYSSSQYFEALGSDRDDSLRYAYRVNLLENRATRDDESMEMLTLVFDNRIFDIALALNLEGLEGKLQSVCTSDTNPNFGSEIGAMPDIIYLIEKELEGLNEMKYK